MDSFEFNLFTLFKAISLLKKKKKKWLTDTARL